MQKLKYIFVLAFVQLLSLSCAKDIDFDQANSFKVSPVIETSFIFIDESANQFLDNGSIVVFEDFVLVDFFNNKFIVEDLIKAELVFEIANSIHRVFQLQIDFLDALDQTQHSFMFEGKSSVDNGDVVSNHTETFVGRELVALKATRKMVFTLRVLPGSVFNQSTLGNVRLKSKAIFSFNTGF